MAISSIPSLPLLLYRRSLKPPLRLRLPFPLSSGEGGMNMANHNSFDNQHDINNPSPLSATRLLGDPKQSHGYNIARVTFFVFVAIIVVASVFSIVTWFVYGSDLPVFHMQRLDVPAFNITNIMLNAEWIINISIQNPNRKFQVIFDHIQLSLIYKDYVLDTLESDQKEFSLEPNEKKTLNAEFNVTRKAENVADAMWMRDMGNERSKGFMDFDLSISLEAEFKSSSSVQARKRLSLRVICDDLEVKLPENPNSNGGIRRNGDIPRFKDCLLLPR